MAKSNVVNQYFKEFEKSSKCRKTDQITGLKYSITCKDERGEILRCFVDNHIEASLSNVRSQRNHLFKYIKGSDLIIVGLCLSGQKTINYKGDHIVKKGDIVINALVGMLVLTLYSRVKKNGGEKLVKQ